MSEPTRKRVKKGAQPFFNAVVAEEKATLKKRVQDAVVKVYGEIQGDLYTLPEPVTLADITELCLDAHRPVQMGGLSQEDYDALCRLDHDEVDGWAREVLRRYV